MGLEGRTNEGRREIPDPLYPWAVIYRRMLAEAATRNLILGSMVSFMAILLVGYVYAVKKRAFDWKS